VLWMGSVTNNSTRVRIGYRIYSLWRFTATNSCYTGYNYSEHYSTGGFSDPIDGTALRWRLTSRTQWWRLIPKANGRGLSKTLLLSPLFSTVPATMETLAHLLLVTMQRNNTGVVSVSMELFDYGRLVTTAFSQTRHNIYKPFVSPGSVQQIMPYRLWLEPPRQSRHLDGRTRDRRQV
jgi:hypothetical protein